MRIWGSWKLPLSFCGVKVGWVVCTVIFMSNPTTVLRFCCCWGRDNTRNSILNPSLLKLICILLQNVWSVNTAWILIQSILRIIRGTFMRIAIEELKVGPCQTTVASDGTSLETLINIHLNILDGSITIVGTLIESLGHGATQLSLVWGGRNVMSSCAGPVNRVLVSYIFFLFIFFFSFFIFVIILPFFLMFFFFFAKLSFNLNFNSNLVERPTQPPSPEKSKNHLKTPSLPPTTT